MIKDLKIAFFGTSRLSVIILDELKNSFSLVPHSIVTVPDKPVGRKQIISPSLAKIWANEHNSTAGENQIEIFQPENLKAPEVTEKLKKYDLFIVASYGKIIPKSILELPKYGAINIHPSLLPKYRGPSPIQGQILAGEKKVGVSIMIMDEKMDHGPILAQQEVEFENPFLGNYLDVEEKLAKESANLLYPTLEKWLEKKVIPQEQDHTEATYTELVKKEDAEIKLEGNSEENYRKYLAYYEWPKTFFFSSEVDKKSGTKKRNIITQATLGNGEFKIIKIIPEGKSERNFN